MTAEVVARIVAEAPPFTPEQVASLSVLLRPEPSAKAS